MIAPHAPWWADTHRQDQADAFAVRYATRSGVTVEWLRAWGRFPEPCYCGEPGCEGFAMNFAYEDALVEHFLFHRTTEPADPELSALRNRLLTILARASNVVEIDWSWWPQARNARPGSIEDTLHASIEALAVAIRPVPENNGNRHREG